MKGILISFMVTTISFIFFIGIFLVTNGKHVDLIDILDYYWKIIIFFTPVFYFGFKFFKMVFLEFGGEIVRAIKNDSKRRWIYISAFIFVATRIVLDILGY